LQPEAVAGLGSACQITSKSMQGFVFFFSFRPPNRFTCYTCPAFVQFNNSNKTGETAAALFIRARKALLTANM